MPKMKRRKEETDIVTGNSKRRKSIDEIDELRKIVVIYSTEAQRDANLNADCDDNNAPEKKDMVSLEISGQLEVKSFFEELMKLLGSIPPLLQIKSTRIDNSIHVEKGNDKSPDGPDDPNNSVVNIYNVVNIIFNRG